MPSLNFKKEFVPLIESGEKRQTIRENTPHWKKLKAGYNLYLFTGLRTKNSKRIVPNFAKTFYNFYENRCAVIYKSVEIIRLYSNPYVIEIFDMEMKRKEIISFTQKDYEKFAKADGFDNHIDFFNFFKSQFKSQYGLPFEGVLIKW